MARPRREGVGHVGSQPCAGAGADRLLDCGGARTPALAGRVPCPARLAPAGGLVVTGARLRAVPVGDGLQRLLLPKGVHGSRRSAGTRWPPADRTGTCGIPATWARSWASVGTPLPAGLHWWALIPGSLASGALFVVRTGLEDRTPRQGACLATEEYAQADALPARARTYGDGHTLPAGGPAFAWPKER